jgi:hypothetical protein
VVQGFADVEGYRITAAGARGFVMPGIAGYNMALFFFNLI